MILILASRIRTALLASTVLLLCSHATVSAEEAGDADKGKVVFARCAMCHSARRGENKVGPSLAGVVGQKAGKAPGFSYSPAMAGLNILWSNINLDKFLANPGAVVPGTRMTFAGLPNPADRANVIAYLAKQVK